MHIHGRYEGSKEKMRAALGLKSEWDYPSWPLPNMAEATEADFWGWQRSYSFHAEASAGQRKIDGEHATLILYFANIATMVDAGFAVTISETYGKKRIRYWRWAACDHAFKSVEYRNCYEKLRCERCSATYEIYSD